MLGGVMLRKNSCKKTMFAAVAVWSKPALHPCLLLTAIFFCNLSAHAQFCPAPWNSVSTMYGTVILEGNGTGTNGPYTTTTNESASMQFTMAAQAGCSWVTATKVGMGSGSDQIFMKDQLIDTTCPAPQTDIWSGSAPGDNLQVTFGISPFVN